MPTSIEGRAVGIIVLLALLAGLPLTAQQDSYDLLLTGGHVIDPANEIDGVRDVAIRNGRIARVAASIPADSAKRRVDLKGLYVVPGLVDIHSHHYGYSGALFPDDVALPAGTTTVVDAGGPGWRNFEDYREKILRRSKTRVLTFINIVGLGMGGNESNVEDMDSQATARKILEYPDLIVGIKNAHFERSGIHLCRTGRGSRPSFESSGHPGQQHPELDRAGYAHQGAGEDAARRSAHPLLQRPARGAARPANGQIQPFMHEARKRGVLFDLGHGGGSFLWTVADRAMSLGFPPDIISTDIHASSILDHAVGHAQLHVEDDDARHGAEGDHLPLHRDPGARHQSFSRDRHARRGPGGRHRRPGDRGRRVRLSRRLGEEAPGDAPHRERAHGPGRRDRLRPRRPRVCRLGRYPRAARAVPPRRRRVTKRSRDHEAAEAVVGAQRTRSTTCCSRTAS